MKRLFIPVTLMAILLLASCHPATITPTQVDVSAISTSAVETAYAALTQAAPTATTVPTLTATLAATDTPTATATPDFSAIKFDVIYFQNGTKLVLTFHLNNVRGQFSGEGNGYLFECSTLPDTPDNLRCVGSYQAPGRRLLFHLLANSTTAPILEVELIIPNTYPSTPVGMWCEIEPLWVAPLTGPEGCYAVTCYLNGVFVNEGTPNTCDQPWRYGPVP